MVIGTGLMANAFLAEFGKRDDVVVFASGVAHSKVLAKEQFDRERNLLFHTLKTNREKNIIYFSTCSVYDASEALAPYVSHKIAMEELIKENFARFMIFRLSNLVGFTTNFHTVFNFFVRHILQDLPFVLWKNAYRNLIDVQDVVALVKHFATEGDYINQTINVAHPVSYKATEIVARIEHFFKRKANYTAVDKGSFFTIDTTLVEQVTSKIGLDFSEGYIDKLLHRYYQEEVLKQW
jgi:nucleoside-diphosphate-sugar epimerase